MRDTCSRLAICVFTLSLVGCSGGAVQEDRTINFGSGKQSGFQHGAAGVFIDVDGETRRIFKPQLAQNVLATSSPLWSPDKRYVIFTTAAPAGGANQSGQVSDWNATPDGRVFVQQAVDYTCWLYDTQVQQQGEAPNSAIAVFKQSCGHVGYVAANLAVRWTPDSSGIAFVCANQGKHELKRWDIKTGIATKLFPHAVDWLSFEYTEHDSQLLVCTEDTHNEGVWCGSAGTKWWHVAKARGGAYGLQTATASLGNVFAFLPSLVSQSPLQRLRGLQPVWSSDGAKFAFVAHETMTDPSGQNKPSQQYTIIIASPAENSTDVVLQSDVAISDVHWHPNGAELGYVQHRASAATRTSVQAINIAKKTERKLLDRSVHQFAGWNPVGEQAAVVVPVVEGDSQPNWAFAMVPARPGREALVLDGPAGSQELFAGTRVTFPSWSEDGQQLSFWSTFTPSYQSWQNILRNQGLPNGDPAATVDVATGTIHWMPVSALEKLQVGHYYLLKNDVDEAIRWYDEAAPQLPGLTEANRAVLSTAALYRSICFGRLGKQAEANAAYQQFVKLAVAQSPQPTAIEQAATPTAATPTASDPAADPDAIMFRYLLLLETYLSVDAIDECRDLLVSQLSNSTATEQLAQQIALGQIYLIQEQRSKYVNLAIEGLLPNAIQQVGSTNANMGQVAFDRPMLCSTQLSLLPLMSPQFVGELSAADLDVVIAGCEELRTDQTLDVPALALDRILVVAHGVASQATDSENAAARLARNVRSSQLPDKSLRTAIRLLKAWPYVEGIMEESMSPPVASE